MMPHQFEEQNDNANATSFSPQDGVGERTYNTKGVPEGHLPISVGLQFNNTGATPEAIANVTRDQQSYQTPLRQKSCASRSLFNQHQGTPPQFIRPMEINETTPPRVNKENSPPLSTLFTSGMRLGASHRSSSVDQKGINN